MARYVCRYPAPVPRIGGGGASNEFRKATNQDKNETGGTPPAPRSGLTQHAATHWHPSVSAFFPPLCIRCFPEFVGSSLLRLSSPLCIHGSNIPTDDNDLPEQSVATGTSHWVVGAARFVVSMPRTARSARSRSRQTSRANGELIADRPNSGEFGYHARQARTSGPHGMRRSQAMMRTQQPDLILLVAVSLAVLTSPVVLFAASRPSFWPHRLPLTYIQSGFTTNDPPAWFYATFERRKLRAECAAQFFDGAEVLDLNVDTAAGRRDVRDLASAMKAVSDERGQAFYGFWSFPRLPGFFWDRHIQTQPKEYRAYSLKSDGSVWLRGPSLPEENESKIRATLIPSTSGGPSIARSSP